MKYILLIITLVSLSFFACKEDLSKKIDSVAAGSPTFQAMKAMEAQADKGMPEVIMYQKSMRELLHGFEKANQFDSISTTVRKHLSELNKAEQTLAMYKANFKGRLDTLPMEKREAYVMHGKAMAETARDMVLYRVQETKKLVGQLTDSGVQVPGLPQ